MMEPPPARLQVRDAVLGHPEHRLEVDGHHAVPPALVGLQHRAVAVLPEHAGVVVEHVERAEAPHALVDHALHVGLERHVADDGERLAAGRRSTAGHGVLRGLARRCRPRRCARPSSAKSTAAASRPDALARPGDERDLPLASAARGHGSDPLEVADQLPVGHRGVEGLLLEARGVQVVLDDAVRRSASRATWERSSAATASRSVFGTWGSVASS